MRILVFGGTVFVSRNMTETAVAAGHDVTTFNRGLSGPDVQGVTALRGDRASAQDLGQLAGSQFDLVFDTAYDPALARAAATLLAPSCAHYAYVSSINAFPGWPEQPDYRAGGVWDGDPDADDEVPDEVGENAYGWRKVSAERAVQRAFGAERSTMLRAGCIVGPYDGVGRLPWWLDRVARGGRLLAPGSPTDPVVTIDARDLAEFALLRAPGAFETTGPADQITRAEFIAEAAEVTGGRVAPVWASDEYLNGKVEGWTEMPLWLAQAEGPSLFKHDNTDAVRAGLRPRPVRETMTDTWRWMQGVAGGWHPSDRTPGLDPTKEAELLDDLTDAGAG